MGKIIKTIFNLRNICITIVLIMSFCTLVIACINHCKAKNEFQNIMKIHKSAIDTLKYSSNNVLVCDSLFRNDIKQSLERTAPKIEACSDWFFDNNTITFLVSFALVLLITLLLDLQSKLRNEYKELTKEINSKVNEINAMEERNRIDRETIRDKYIKEYEDNVEKENKKLEDFSNEIYKISEALNKNKQIISNNMDSANISIQFKSLFLESLFFSLSLKFNNFVINSKFAELAYFMDKRKKSIYEFLSQNKDFKIEHDTKADIFETLINTIRNIEIDKIRKQATNNGKTVPYDNLCAELKELLKIVRELKVSDSL